MKLADFKNSEGYPDPTAYEALRRIEKKKYRPVVFICSPYSGDTEKNTAEAKRYSRFAYEMGNIPVAPHLMYPQFMDEGKRRERADALRMGQILLSRCDEMWVVGDEISEGMRREINMARKRHHTRIRYFTSGLKEAQPNEQPGI